MLEPISPEQRQWERSCHHAITSDVIWKLDVYRSSLFLLVNARDDQFAAVRRPLDPSLASQLVRSAASVSANIGEGYSRSTRTDRLRFLSYALGSTRECVSWYEASLGSVDRETLDSRLTLLERNRVLLLGLMRSVRERGVGGQRFEP
jgi:four helix bundle protein